MAVLTFASGGRSQEGEDAVSRLLYADAQKFLAATEPEVRGEAALTLAAAGEPRHYDAVLQVARADEPAARLRGILALGYLGDAAAVPTLESLLAASGTRPKPEGIAAAFALGMLPDGRADAAVASQLLHFQESSSKRQRPVLTALVTALVARGSTAQFAPLLQLAEDDSIRDPSLRALLLRASAHMPNGLPRARILAALDASPEERVAILTSISGEDAAPAATLLTAVERSATKSPTAEVRAAALLALARMRHLPTLDLAVAALRSDQQIEVEAGTRAALLLGGDPMRRGIERAFDGMSRPQQTGVLTAWSGPLSPEFQTSCERLARSSSTPLPLRTVAALALAQGSTLEQNGLLTELFVANEDPIALRRLARAINRLETPPPLESLHAGDVDALAADAERLTALLLAGHRDASRYCSQQLQRKELPPTKAAALLRAVRTYRLPQLPPDLAAALPDPLPPLLR